MIIDWTSGEYFQPQRYYGVTLILTWVSGIGLVVATPEGWVLGQWLLGWKDAGMPSDTSVEFDMPLREALFDMPTRTVKFDMPTREVEIEI